MSCPRTLDQFYTKRPIARDCLSFLDQAVELGPDDFFVEPSAGDGAFFELLPVARRLGVDIDPRHPGLLRQDFLTEFSLPPRDARWFVVGNPPFGRNTRLAIQFFNRAAEFASVIAFVVPLTFRKASIQHRLDRQFHLVAERPLPRNSFVFEGQPRDVPCCFQIWARQTSERACTELPTEHPPFAFCTPPQAELAVQRVGRKAGRVLRLNADSRTLPRTAHYFLRPKPGAPQELAEILMGLDWSQSKWNTAGVASVGKRELIAQYAKALSA